jgi:PAS domain S-box-containing protein
LLEQERDRLEQRVEARTAELAQANAQLQDEIRERRQAQDALQQQRDLLQVTLTSIGDGVLTTDTQGRVTLLNAPAEQMTGWTNDEALGRDHVEVFQVIHEYSREPMETPIAQVLREGKTVSLANHAVLLGREGQNAIIADCGAPIRDRQGKLYGAVLVFRDTTRERQLEEQLIRAKKLESVGLLAAGIAHDFNNLLAVITGNLSILRLLPLSEEGTAWVQETETACGRATSLTRQLLTFAKGSAPMRQVIDVRQLLAEATQFALRGSNVRSELHLALDLWPADVDAGQLHQVIHNVVLNAVQAMPEGGIVQVQAQNSQMTDAAPLPLEAGRYVRISVKDCGRGIRAQDLPNIFDPYFTTKPQGSGLGLAIAYAIVSKHDGHITVTSSPGMGTTVDIYLPASQAEAVAVQDPRPLVAGTLSSGSGRILVLDDEEQICRMLQAMLPTLGYQATCVTRGEEAIASYREALLAGRPYAVVILDLTIPGGMGGREVFTHLQALDPEVNALVSSGYADNFVMEDYAQYGFRGAVPKPYTIEELSRMLQHVLSDPPGNTPSQTTPESFL